MPRRFNLLVRCAHPSASYVRSHGLEACLVGAVVKANTSFVLTTPRAFFFFLSTDF
eukprot:SAG11_NODE_11605_length_749_cov_2.526154_1_plen_55_part_10